MCIYIQCYLKSVLKPVILNLKLKHSVNATDQAGILHLSGSFHTTFKDSKKMCIAFLA